MKRICDLYDYKQAKALEEKCYLKPNETECRTIVEKLGPKLNMFINNIKA
ncbi:MAG: hypothetical protein SRB1_00158 [Desulfobacteraceae bacterium Eth-SRB1]|nr:MAG: hypothetical protein SRB1_00158 [Desulfobacteraceae bacterium Eth-SRB1]